MHLRSATKVGAIVVLAAVVGVAIYTYFLGAMSRHQQYPVSVSFPDIQNLERGARVRLAGVVIGGVDSIDLGPHDTAQVKLGIDRKYSIPAGSRAQVTAGGLIGEKYVDIIPNRAAGSNLPKNGHAELQPMPGVEFNDFMENANNFLNNSRDLLQQTLVVVKNAQTATAAISRLLADPSLNRNMRQTLANADRAAAHLDQLTDSFQDITKSSEPDLKHLAHNMVAASGGIRDLTATLNSFLADSSVRNNLHGTVANLEQATSRLNAIATNFQTMTGDPTLQKNLKTTIANVQASSEELKATMDQAQQAVTSVNQAVQRITGHHKRAPGAHSSAATNAVKTMASLDVYQGLGSAGPRVDATGILPLGSHEFGMAGLRDLGESNSLNLQIGRSIGHDWTVRYGLHASRLGIGLDKGLTARSGVSLDLYRPRRLQIDLYGHQRVGHDIYAILGVESLFHGNRPTIGVQIRR